MGGGGGVNERGGGIEVLLSMLWVGAGRQPMTTDDNDNDEDVPVL